MFESNGKTNGVGSTGNSTETLIHKVPLKKGKKIYVTMKVKNAENKVHNFGGVIKIE